MKSLWCAALLLFATSSQVSFAMGRNGLNPADESVVFINKLGTQAIQLLGEQVAPADRLDGFRKILGDYFDIKSIGRFVLGRYWRQATPEQQQQFFDLYAEFTARLYAGKLSEFNAATFTVTANAKNDDEYIVTSEVAARDTPTVKIAWHLSLKDNQYKITDVVLADVSMKMTEREEFAGIIQRNDGTVGSLIAVLPQLIAQGM